MSFGTGHHPTTYLMMKAMKAIDFKQKSVLDMGSGTGILSILAYKLGSENIDAVDKKKFKIDYGVKIKNITNENLMQYQKYIQDPAILKFFHQFAHQQDLHRLF